MKRIDRVRIVLLAAAVVATGCNDNAKDGTRAESSAPQRSQPVTRIETMTLPAGLHVVAALETRLNSGSNHTGDPFVATTTEAIVVNGKTVAPAGTKILGNLRDVKASGRVNGRGAMTLTYDEIVDSAGKSHPMSAQPLTLQAASETHSDVEKIAAGGVLGAVIGGIAGGGKGAAIGAGAGAGAGTVLMLATKGADIELDPGQKLYIHLLGATTIPVVAQR